MAYLGKGLGSLTTANITVDKMTGNGSTATLAITLAQGVNSVNDISVFVSGVMQRPGTDYTLSGSTLTFTTAPANGLQVVAVSHGDSVLDCVADATAITASFDNNSVPDSAIGSLAASKLTGALAGVATNLTGLNAAQLTGALPAVAATNLTNLTSANLTGALPALSAANLTGISSYTKSASDPATNTNPSGGTGSVWVNSTSGETYVCTDATADANVWTNVGGGDGDVQPYTYQGTQYGYSFGGTYPSNDDVQRYSYTSDGNSTNMGDRGRTKESYTSTSSDTHGYVMGGGAAMVDNIDKFSFSAAAGFTGTDIGNLTQARRWLAGCSSDGYGWAVGGRTSSSPSSETNRIDRFPFATDTDATDWADLFVAQGLGSSSSSTDYGYRVGNGYPHTDVIQRFPFATQTTGTDVGNLAIASGAHGGTSSTTHGYALGAGENPLGDYIQKFAFASSSNASDVANLLGNLWEMSCSSSTTYGYSAQGSPSNGGVSTNTIQKHSFSSDSNATDVGDTTVTANYCGLGCQF